MSILYAENIQSFLQSIESGRGDPGPIRCLLLTDNGTYDAEDTNIGDILDSGNGDAVECSVSSYARQELTGVAITANTIDTKNYVVELTCDNIDFGNLESGETITGVLFYCFLTNDAGSIPLVLFDGETRIKTCGPMPAPLTGSITGVSNQANCLITSAGHGLTTGQKIYIQSVGGATQINSSGYTVTVVDTNTFTIGVDSTSWGTYTSGGTWKQIQDLYCNELIQDVAVNAPISFSNGRTATVYQGALIGQSKIEIIDLSGTVPHATTATTKTTAGLPFALNGLNVTFSMPSGVLFSIASGEV